MACTGKRCVLPTYWGITSTSIGNGEDTTFWLDRWIAGAPLTELMPALYSHHTRVAAPVREVVQADLRSQFQRRLSTQAAEEIRQLTQMLQGVVLTEDADARTSYFEDGCRQLMSGLI